MKQIILFVLLAFSFECYAQKVSVALTPVVEIPVSQDLIKTETGYLSYKINKRKLKIMTMFSTTSFSKLLFNVTLIQYDESLKVIKENDLSNSDIRFGAFEPTIEKINNKQYLIYYEPLENDNEIWLKAIEVNPSNLTIAPPKNLFKIEINKRVGVGKLLSIANKRKLWIKTSPDRSKTLFLFENGIDNSFTYCVTDKDLKVLWGKSNLIDIPENIVITSPCVDNTANVYTAYKIESRKNGIKGHILICNPAKKEKDISVSEDDEMYQILVLPSKKQNIIHVAGTCFGGTQYISSVFSATISVPNFKLTNFKKTDFEEKFINLFEQDDLAFTKKNKYGLHPSHMRIYELDDGSVGMIGEIKKVKTSTKMHQNVSGTYNTSSTTLLTSGSILNVCFKKDKPVFSRVPKNREVYLGASQGAIPDSYSDDLRLTSYSAGDGIYALPYKNDVVVFYSDNENNLQKDITEMPSNADKVRKLVLVAATISNDGNIKREMLVDLKEDDFIALPSGIRYITATSLQIPIRRVSKIGGVKDDFRWGNLEIK